MTNPHKGEVNVSLAGVEYKCRLTINALMQIEAATGIGIIKLATQMGEGNISITHLIAVLHPALRGGGNNLSEKDVMAIASDAGIIPVTKVVAELLAETLSDRSEDDEGGEKKLEA